MAKLIINDTDHAQKGLTIFITGLSGAGKTTLAKNIEKWFLTEIKRPVTLLDGDVFRKHLSSELGFSKEDRELNVERAGFVACEITKHGGITVCAMIAPYLSSRKKNRELISNYGGYVEVYVSTSLEVCEKRDSKGLYAKARQGLIKQFTGISDPYEAPEKPEVIVDAGKLNPEKSTQKVICFLRLEGYIK